MTEDITTPPEGTPRGIILRRYHDIKKARSVGRSWNEIAEALNLTVSATKAALARVETGIKSGRIDPTALPRAAARELPPIDPPPPRFRMTGSDDLPPPKPPPPTATPALAPDSDPASPGYGPAVLSQPPRLGILATLQKMQSKY